MPETIRVAEDDGAVRVGRDLAVDGAADVATLVLDVRGGTLFWRLDDDRPPSAWIDDPGAAASWLWDVYGDAVAIAVDAVARDGGAVDATPSMGPSASRARRLAYAQWAARWWPASAIDDVPSLPGAPLVAEIGALTHHCESIVDEEVARADVALAVESARSLLDWWRADPGPVGDTAGALLRLVADAAEAHGLDTSDLLDLVDEMDGPRVGERPTSVSPDDYALAAGAHDRTGRVIAAGLGVNDWRRYPPGLVDAAEDAVAWTARAVGAERRIDVDVAGGDIDADVGLSADVVVDGATERIRLMPGDGSWRGGAPLTGRVTDATRFDVGVVLPGFDPGPTSDGRSIRDAVREVVRARLDLAAATPPSVDDGPLLSEALAAGRG